MNAESKKIAAICLLAGIVIGITAAFLFIGSAGNEYNGGAENVPIGMLLPLSGDLKERGISIEAGLDEFLPAINQKYSGTGHDMKFYFVKGDSGTSAKKAMASLKTMKEQGVKVVIGPVSSDVLEAVSDYAAENDMILISPSSTAPSLSKEDYIFRFVPDDEKQAEALSYLMKTEGADHVVIAYRDDIWGNDLEKFIQKELSERDVLTTATSYDPEERDFSGVVRSIQNDLDSVTANHPDYETAVVILGYDETYEILKEAAFVPGLEEHMWYGSDAFAGNIQVFEDSEIWDFILSTDFKASVCGVLNSDFYPGLSERIEEKTGSKPVPQAYVACDALMVATDAIRINGHDSEISVIAKSIFQRAYSGYASTGWTVLGSTGDRVSIYYEFLTPDFSKDSEKWDVTARYGTLPVIGTFFSERIEGTDSWNYVSLNNMCPE